jgi:hypothetical protein
MKYSLRSLMTFSIRDLFLVTLCVALAVGWFCHWKSLDRRYATRGEYVERLKDRLARTISENNYRQQLLEQGPRRYVIPPLPPSFLPPDLQNEP